MKSDLSATRDPLISSPMYGKISGIPFIQHKWSNFFAIKNFLFNFVRLFFCYINTEWVKLYDWQGFSLLDPYSWFTLSTHRNTIWIILNTWNASYSNVFNINTRDSLQVFSYQTDRVILTASSKESFKNCMFSGFSNENSFIATELHCSFIYNYNHLLMKTLLIVLKAICLRKLNKK